MGLFSFLTKKKTEIQGGVFFGLADKKKSKFDKEKFVEAFKEMLPELTNLLRKNESDMYAANSDLLERSVENSAKLYDWIANNYATHDFLQPAARTGGFDGFAVNISPGTEISNAAFNNQQPTPIEASEPFGHVKQLPEKREPAKKPKEVVTELEHQIDEVSLKDLDDKIQLLNDKLSLTVQKYSEAELKGMVQRLENRKKFNEYKDFFGKFPCTTDQKIEDLLKKYKFQMGTTDIFIPDFPKEAIDVMKAYKEKTVELCGKESAFYVIARESDFKKNRDKRDPILLAQSPFGLFWNILGAWDEEMVVLSEL